MAATVEGLQAIHAATTELSIGSPPVSPPRYDKAGICEYTMTHSKQSPSQSQRLHTPSTMSSTFYGTPMAYRSEDEGDEKKEEASEPPSLRMSKSMTIPLRKEQAPNRRVTLHYYNSATDEEDGSQPPALRIDQDDGYANSYCKSQPVGISQGNHISHRCDKIKSSDSNDPLGQTDHHEQPQPQSQTLPQPPPSQQQQQHQHHQQQQEQQQQQQQQQQRQQPMYTPFSSSSRNDTSVTCDSETLLKIHVRSTAYATTAFYLPVSLLLAREREMQQAAQSFGISAERWTESLLHRTYQQRNKKHQYSAVSILSEDSEWRTFELDPERECAESNFSHTLRWEPWLTACIRAYYNTGSIRIPDECIGSDILLALEYFGIVYAPDQLVFDSFGAYLRVKLWSDYFTQRASMADWLVQTMLSKSVARYSHAFCTSPSERERTNIFQLLATGPHRPENRLDIFDGGLQLDPSKYENTPSCAVVHDFFTDTSNGNESSSISTIKDALMRDDFRAYLEKSLPGTQVTFDMEPAQMISPATGQSETISRAVLHIDVLAPASKSMTSTEEGDKVVVGLPPSNEPTLPVGPPVVTPSSAAFFHQGRVRQAANVTPAPVASPEPSRDTTSADEEVARLTLPKASSMFTHNELRYDFPSQEPQHFGPKSLPNTQSYEETIQQRASDQKQPSTQHLMQRSRSIPESCRYDTPEPQHDDAHLPTQNPPFVAQNDLVRRIGGGVELRPTPSVDHIYIDLGNDNGTATARLQPQNELPPRGPHVSSQQRSLHHAMTGGHIPHQHQRMHHHHHHNLFAEAPLERVPPTASSRRAYARRVDDRPRRATDSEESLLHMSDVEKDYYAPIDVVVTAGTDNESVASTLSGPVTVDELPPPINHARSFATPVEALSVTDSERVAAHHRHAAQQYVIPVATSHLAELQQLSLAEQEDFYRWQQLQIQRRRRIQQQEHDLQQQQLQQEHLKYVDTPVSTPDRSASQGSLLAGCHTASWLDYICEAMKVPGSEEAERSNRRTLAASRNTPLRPNLSPATSTDETSSPPMEVPKVRRTPTFPTMDPSPSTAWIADAIGFVRSVFEVDGSVSTASQKDWSLHDVEETDPVERERSPTYVEDSLTQSQPCQTKGILSQQHSTVQMRGLPNNANQDWDAQAESMNSDKHRALHSGANRMQQQIRKDQQDLSSTIVKSKSWNQPFHIAGNSSTTRTMSPKTVNPRSILLNDRPKINGKTLPRGAVTNHQQSGSALRSKKTPTPTPPLSEKGGKKRGNGLKGLFGFRRKNNVGAS